MAGMCSIGRSAGNTIPLQDSEASRRHAMIHAQSNNEFWLIDLGSKNGSYLNGRRVHHPTQLKHDDKVKFGSVEFQFQQPDAEDEFFSSPTAGPETVTVVRQDKCWLLMMDIEGFTALSQKAEVGDLAQLVGKWVMECSDAIATNDGVVNKYLGDGIFAYWHDGPQTASNVFGAVRQIQEFQKRPAPKFRAVFHYGDVTLGGASAAGEENLMGPEVNFLFRSEKVVGGLGSYLSFSASAAKHWPKQDELKSLGQHPVKDYAGEHEFFSLNGV